MPEGPELHLACRLVNSVCSGRLFSGKVVKSEVSHKNPEVDWDAKHYTISAQSRGKEVKLTLQECSKTDEKKSTKHVGGGKTMDIVFRFGMSGKFAFEKVTGMHKHAHLNFFTSTDSMVLSYVDVRRFGKWEPNGTWAKHRGPCIIFDYKEFRSNVLSNLGNSVFKTRPICEVMLDQKYFNGVGNYLRAEVLYRLRIPPFVQAYSVLESLDTRENVEDGKLLNKDNPDLIDMCTILAREVIGLGATNYTEENDAKDHSAFNEWLQCYYQPGMKNIHDHNKRTMWFAGNPGPMAPRDGATKKMKRSAKKGKAETDDESIPKKKIKKEIKTEDQNGTRARRSKVKQEAPEDEDYVAPSTSAKRTRRSRVKKEEASEEVVQTTKRSARKSAESSSPSLARTKQTKLAGKTIEKKETKTTGRKARKGPVSAPEPTRRSTRSTKK